MSEESFEAIAERLKIDLNKVQKPGEKGVLEEVEDPKEKAPKSPLERFMDRFKDHPECPSLQTIESWKKTYIGVYMFNAEVEGETYLWRPLNRTEWKQLRALGENLSEDQFNEMVVGKCVLWPKMTDTRIAASRAGLCATLFACIMAGSYFMREEAALQFTEKL